MANSAEAQVPQHILEQYKSYVSDLGNIGSRYTTAQTFYFTIVAALVGALAIKDVKTPLSDYATPTFVVLMLFIAAICFIWRRTLRHYRNLFGAKFKVLNELTDT